MIGPGGASATVCAYDFLADYYASRFSRSREVIRAAAVPLLVLIFASVVLFVATALFAPLISMMDHLTQTVLSHK
jgi:type II secretory pathway component PulF